MPIRPLKESENSQLWQTVQSAIQTAPIIKCQDSSCQSCYGAEVRTREFAHYSRNGVVDWKANGSGNQLCWSEFVSDREDGLALMTDQHNRPYVQLCLIKVCDCPKLPIHFEQFTVKHFRVGFDIPSSLIVKFKLAIIPGSSPATYQCI